MKNYTNFTTGNICLRAIRNKSKYIIFFTHERDNIGKFFLRKKSHQFCTILCEKCIPSFLYFIGNSWISPFKSWFCYVYLERISQLYQMAYLLIREIPIMISISIFELSADRRVVMYRRFGDGS